MKGNFLHLNNILFVAAMSFTSAGISQKQDPHLLDKLLANHPEFFNAVLNDSAKKEVQILYTQIDRDKYDRPHFISYSYRLNDQHYFYPASTVKLAVAIFALEKLHALNIPGLSKETSMLTDSAWTGQIKVTLDSSAENGLPSIAHYIKKILLVSDNDAYNRLYEFVGRAEINDKLKRHGLIHSRIINRLAIGDGGENAKHTNPIRFIEDGKIIYQQPAQYDARDYPLQLTNTRRGKGFLNSEDKLVNEPFDFGSRNVFPLSDQQELLKKLMFPDSYQKEDQFLLTQEDYEFLYRYMSRYPTESTWPAYDSTAFYTTYAKFLFYGAEKSAVVQPGIRIFNKIGDSYGYMIDNSYFVDYKNKVEFFLAAVIQSNNNEIYNDNIYEYKTVCLPFLKNLGQLIYDLELKRPKKHLPKKFPFY